MQEGFSSVLTAGIWNVPYGVPDSGLCSAGFRRALSAGRPAGEELLFAYYCLYILILQQYIIRQISLRSAGGRVLYWRQRLPGRILFIL